MSANFTLELSNPDVQSGPPSIVYANAANRLALQLQNSSGYDRQFGGGATVSPLQVQISANILAAAGAVTVDPPWALVQTRATAAGGPTTTITLQPPDSGVPFPNGSTVTVRLESLTPTATGIGQARVHYQFDQVDSLSATAPLTSMVKPSPAQQTLIGESGALRLTLFVNNGPDSNPLMVTPTPAENSNAVENSLRFQLMYEAASVSAQQGQAASGLVPGWDAARPPTFRVFFPCFTPFDGAPAAVDLTDSFTYADAGYNPLTSAWNIPPTLTPNKNVLNDGWWVIAPGSGAPIPIWTITPTPENQNLFTSAVGSPNQPGPFLDWYLGPIVSALLDPAQPETIVYVQWTNVPGFNDGLVAYPLVKTRMAISSFTCAVRRALSLPPDLVAEWATEGADHCTITGDSNRQQAQAGSAGTPAYVKSLKPDQPLRSAYTLTAVGPDGVTQVSRTLVVSWAVSAVQPATLPSAAGVQVTPDGTKLLVRCGQPLSVALFSPRTLLPLPHDPLAAGSDDADGCAVSPDDSAVFIAGEDGRVYGYDLTTLNPTSGSPAPFAGGIPPPYLVLVSRDGQQVVIVMSAPNDEGVQFVALPSASLAIAQRHPSQATSVSNVLVGPATGRYFVVNSSGIAAVDPSFRPLSTVQQSLSMMGPLAAAPDESRFFAIGTNASFVPFIMGLEPRRLEAVQLMAIALATAFSSIPMPRLVVSADGAIVFVIGSSFEKAMLASRLRAYDAATFAELPWSPVDFGDPLPATVAVSPDGTRMFVLAVDEFATTTDKTRLFAVDPSFS